MSEQNQVNWQRTNLDHIEQAWEGDLWDRKRLGEQLTRYVDRLNCGAVLALDARWGEGKTWFVRHWKKHLEDENHNVIYLDAFANDYLEDPFLVISSEIAARLDQTADKSLVHKFKKAAAVMQQGLLTQAPTIIASMISFALTGGIIPFLKIDNESIKEKYDDIVDNVTDNIGEKVTEAIQNKIDDYEEEKQSLSAFKETLGKLAESLDKSLVFIIDELDRCRPDFAIRLIERIKHFFDIPKIVFVLVMDKTQFSKVVCHNYGYDEKLGEEYLDKFVDFLIPLPLISKLNKNEIAYFSVLKKLLYAVGEESDDINLILYFALTEKNISPRFLKKKINEYALLRTNDTKKNMFLMLAIITNPLNLLDKIELFSNNIYRSIVENGSITFQTLSKKELEDIERILKLQFEIDAVEFLFLLEQILKIYGRYQNIISPNPKEKIEKELVDLYSKYSLESLKNHLDISSQYELYLNSNLS
ncbi:P-loop NTPase fold protein [Acinetobacter sp. Marseille-Q1618]|uniref:KAP family P-loop NTPase fold protein n=1 Tax=Acinetobacter sp. Marseille-Q1618 TaxID=2697502 RepID=UPI00156FB848|nr:P-loop NTPase fold protein [Acinetobacter sp. Marseille-Q1618]